VLFWCCSAWLLQVRKQRICEVFIKEPMGQVAAACNQMEMVSLLLSHGAHPFLTTLLKDWLCYSGAAQHGSYRWESKEFVKCSYKSLWDRLQQRAIKWKWCLCSYHMVLIHFFQHCSRTHCVILVLLSVALTGEKAKSLWGVHKRAYGVSYSFHKLKRSECNM